MDPDDRNRAVIYAIATCGCNVFLMLIAGIISLGIAYWVTTVDDPYITTEQTFNSSVQNATGLNVINSLPMAYVAVVYATIAMCLFEVLMLICVTVAVWYEPCHQGY